MFCTQNYSLNGLTFSEDKNFNNNSTPLTLYAYKVQSEKHVPIFWIVQENCAHKNKKRTERTIERRGSAVLSRVSIGGVNFVLYYLSYIHFPYSQFAPIPLFASISATVRILNPLGLGGYAKLYNRVAPQPPNEVDTTTTTHAATDNLSTNHRAYGY